jgi:hypothetical protein
MAVMYSGPILLNALVILVRHPTPPSYTRLIVLIATLSIDKHTIGGSKLTYPCEAGRGQIEGSRCQDEWCSKDEEDTMSQKSGLFFPSCK